ncbi:Voltage-gated Ion Channel (VIC) Superfamily [Thraustotheca clavata]|uniref:Voltage-gated Ion Channel (VIC) Superfamily n=1 Tax=Thraustotheca clavata TaxID=74557 RepID=A0A1V9ZYU8_9STRA|nr:Voltage-gated Ion Channel (VIC) Superfamily [Thraustotheca clavata]
MPTPGRSTRGSNAEMPTEMLLKRLLQGPRKTLAQTICQARLPQKPNSKFLSRMRQTMNYSTHQSKFRSGLSSIEKANEILKDLDIMATNQFSNFARRHRANAFDPNGEFKSRWDCIVMTTLLVFFVFLPLEVCFEVVLISTACVYLQVMMDIIMLTDMLVTLRTTRRDVNTNDEIIDSWHIIIDYLTSPGFLVDALSSFPFGFFFQDYHFVKKILQSLRGIVFFRIYQLAQAQVFSRVEIQFSLLIHPAAVRLFKLAIYYLALHHYIASCYYIVVVYEFSVFHDNLEKVWPIPFTLNDSIGEQYLGSIYQAISVTGLAPMRAQTKLEMLFTFSGYAIGMLANACVFGSVAGLLEQLYKRSDARQYHVDCVGTLMRREKVDEALQEEIYSFYSSFSGDDSLAHDPASMFQPPLPNKMELLLKYNLHQDVVKKVPFFRTLNSEQILALLLTMTESIALPGELIVKAGEKAHAFYIIESGQIDVCDDYGTILSSLGPGGYFGEVSLMNNESTSANVIAQTYCKLNLLLKTHFDMFTQANAQLKSYLNDTKTKRLEVSATVSKRVNILDLPTTETKPSFLAHIFARKMAKKIIHRQRRLGANEKAIPEDQKLWTNNELKTLQLHIKSMSHFKARKLAHLDAITKSIVEIEE